MSVRRIVLLVLSGAICGLNLSAQEYLDIYQTGFHHWLEFGKRITTHPDPDYSPALSGDGKWLLFTSLRSGNPDIYCLPLETGIAYRLTNHVADDYSPCWGKDSGQMFFLSRRSDGEGDLYTRKIDPEKGEKKGPLRQIDNYLGYDAEVTCSPDGEWLAFTTTRLRGQENIWVLNLQSGQIFPLTFDGGRQPQWSPDGRKLAFVHEESHNPDIYVLYFDPIAIEENAFAQPRTFRITSTPWPESSPVWADSASLFFLRHELDTNRDGRIDDHDWPSVIQVEWNDSGALSESQPDPRINDLKLPSRTREKHLLPPDRPVLSITGKDSLLVGAVIVQNQSDLFSWNRHEIERFWQELNIPAVLSQLDSLYSPVLLNALHPLSSARNDSLFTDLERRLRAKRWFLLKGLLERVPLGRRDSVEIALSLARESVFFGRFQDAARWVRVARQKAGSDFQTIIRIARVASEMDLIPPQELFGSPGDSLGSYFQWLDRQRRVRRLLQEDSLSAAALLLDSLEQQSAIPASCRATLFALRQELALLRHQPREAFAACLARLRELPPGVAREQALGDLKQILDELAAFKDPDSWERALQAQLPPDQDIMASFVLTMGLLHRKAGKRQLAIARFKQIVNQFGRPKSVVITATLQLVSLLESDQPDSALQFVNALLDTSTLSPVEKRYLERLKLRLETQIALRQADDHKAFKRLHTIWSRDSTNLQALEGLIRAADRLGNLDSLQKELEEISRKSVHPHCLFYGLGICQILRAGDDEKQLAVAADYLEKSLRLNYETIVAYFILADLYFRLEQVQRESLSRSQPWTWKAVRTLFAPVFWLYEKFTMKKPKEARSWLEQAISILELGLRANDELASPENEARLLRQIGNFYYQMGDYGRSTAFGFFQRAEHFFEWIRAPEERAQYYLEFGHSALLEGELTIAEAALARADSIASQHGYWSTVWRAAYFQGWQYLLRQSPEQALAAFLKADSVPREFILPREQGRLATSLGYTYSLLGEAELVHKFCLQALQQLSEAKSERNQGSSSVRLNVLGYSIPLWNFASLGGQTGRGLFGLSLEDERAIVFQILADNARRHRQTSRFQQSLQKKLELFKKSKDRYGQVITALQLGADALTDDRYWEAMDWFRFSLRESEELEDRRREIQSLFGLTQALLRLNEKVSLDSIFATKKEVSLSSLLSRTDELLQWVGEFPFQYMKEQAELFFCRGLLYWLQAKENRPHSGPLLLKNRFAQSLDDLKTAIDLFHKAGLPQKEMEVLHVLGDFYRVAGLPGRARDVYARAMKISKNYDLWKSSWLLQMKIAAGARTDSSALAALNNARTALLNACRLHPEAKFSRAEKEQARRLYQLLIDFAVVNKQNERALSMASEWFSLQRALSLADSELPAFPDQEEEFRRQYFSVLKEIVYFNQRLLEIKQTRRGGYRLFDQVLDSLILAEDRRRALLQMGKSENPQLLRLFYPEAVTLEQVWQNMEDGEPVLTLFSTDRDLFSWFITKDTLIIHRRPLDLSWFAPEKNASQKADLAKEILKPYAQFLGNSQRLTVIAEAPILLLPFEEFAGTESEQRVSRFPCLDLLLEKPRNHTREHGKLIIVGRGKDLPHLPRSSKLAILEPFVASEREFRSALNTASILLFLRPFSGVANQGLEASFPFAAQKNGGPYSSILSTAPPDDDGFFQLKDLFSASCPGSVAVLPVFLAEDLKVPSRLAVIVSAFQSAGFPALILFDYRDRQVERNFIDLFLQELDLYPPYEAFRRARLRLSGFQGSVVWIGRAN